jgi:plastocyanin
MRRRRCAVVLVVSGLALSAPAGASGATKVVYAGPSGTAQGTFRAKNPAADLDSFSLKRVTVHVGDKVTWIIRGVHSVTFPKQGGADVPFLVPDPAHATYSGATDAAGAPFWFNGQRAIDLNPLGALPQGGKTEDGSALTGSGVTISGRPKPYTLTFTKPGSYRYECVVHPHMEARVEVVPKGRPVPSVAQDRAAAAAQLAKDAKTVKSLAVYSPPPGTVTGGHDRGQAVRFQFFPSTVHVPVGGSLTFKVPSPTEAHTMTFGPTAYLRGLSLVTPIAQPPGPPLLQFNGQVLLPSDTPPALAPVTPTIHGNGFFNTGIVDNDPKSPLRKSATLRFSQAGTYNYICLLHPWMHGTVVVG